MSDDPCKCVKPPVNPLHVPLPFSPLGIVTKTGKVQNNIHKLFQGDCLRICTTAFTLDCEAATPENSLVTFSLVDDRFCKGAPIFQATWDDGITASNEGSELGGIVVKVPEEVTCNLRRGRFMYDIIVTSKLKKHRHTTEEGHILVEYGASAPLPDIPYRPVTDKTQNTAEDTP